MLKCVVLRGLWTTPFFIISVARLRPSLIFTAGRRAGRIIALPSGNKCINALETLGCARKQEEGPPLRLRCGCAGSLVNA